MTSIVVMTMLITVDVIGRSTGLGSLGFALDAAEYCVFLSAFFGAPWILHHNAHVTVDILVHALPPKARQAAEIAANFLGLLTMAVVLFYVCRVGYASWAEHQRVIKSFIFPEWWLISVAGICLLLAVVEFAFRLWHSIVGRPVAGPLAAF